jgi:DNA-binding IclR family transcriptional regulator
VKSADRALAVVEFVAAEGSTNFNAIVTELQLPRSSAHGLLHTLTAAGWLQQSELSRQYTLGLRAWQVGQRYSGHRDIEGIAKPVMDRLAGELNETVQLAQLDGVENVYIAISESEQPMRLASSVGSRLMVHATGVGKALLSMLDPAEAERRLRATTLARFTDNTITDVDELMNVVTKVRERGFAIDDEEYTSGCRCVAVPVLDDGAGLLIAMSVSMPSFRTDGSWPESVTGPLMKAADDIRSIVGIPNPLRTP